MKLSTAVSGDQEEARVTVLQRELTEHHKTLPALEKARDKAEAQYNKAKALVRSLRIASYSRVEYDLEPGQAHKGLHAGHHSAVASEVHRHPSEYLRSVSPTALVMISSLTRPGLLQATVMLELARVIVAREVGAVTNQNDNAGYLRG